MAKNNSWLWVFFVGLILLSFFMSSHKKTAGDLCFSKEPTTTDGYKSEMLSKLQMTCVEASGESALDLYAGLKCKSSLNWDTYLISNTECTTSTLSFLKTGENYLGEYTYKGVTIYKLSDRGDEPNRMLCSYNKDHIIFVAPKEVSNRVYDSEINVKSYIDSFYTCNSEITDNSVCNWYEKSTIDTCSMNDKLEGKCCGPNIPLIAGLAIGIIILLLRFLK